MRDDEYESMATPPLELGKFALSNPDRGEAAISVLQTVAFTQLANAAGNPAMSVPLAWNAAGLPIGLQCLGRIGDEATLFRLAGQLEQAKPWFDRRATLIGSRTLVGSQTLVGSRTLA